MDDMHKTRIKDAVGIIGRLLSENSEGFDGTDISDALSQLGFNQKEIAGAFRFIEKSTLGPFWRKSSRPANSLKSSRLLKTKTRKDISRPMRMLADIEATKIDTRAHDYLLKLHSVGAINTEIMEEIIDRALGSADEAIGLGEIRRLTALLLFMRIHADVSNENLSVSNMLIH